tara:strand:- start:442 stop:597 length:156 start_codon:yes stop_codon:yes gene_type:complete
MSKKKEAQSVEEVETVKVVTKPSSEQAPLVLANLVSSGMTMQDAKKKLGIK